MRSGKNLKIGRETVSYGRNLLAIKDGAFPAPAYAFVNDAWELMAEAMARAVVTNANTPPPDLFARIAQLEPTKERILDFANAYGNIAPGEIISTKPRQRQAIGELLDDWIRAQRGFVPAFTIWKAVAEAEQGNDERLRQMVSWNRRPTELIQIAGSNYRWSYEWPGSLETGRTEIAAMTTGDLFRPARVCLAQEVGSRLAGRISFRLVFTPEGELTRIFLTETLLSNLWLQLGEAATGAMKIRPCKNQKCNTLIIIDPCGSGRRSNRETCSDSCRFAFYESRKEKAFQLWRTENQKPEQIAALFSDLPDRPTDSLTVSRWIARRLRDAEKLTEKEIAKSLKTTESNVRALLARTTRNPRRHMEPRGRKK